MKINSVTRVSTVIKFPLWILFFGWLLVVANVSGSFSFMSSIPGLGKEGADQQAALMLGARQIGQGLILGYGLLQKNVRLLQFLWLMVIIRESIDFAARLISGHGLSPAMFISTLIIELAGFNYLGLVASGRIAKYRPDSQRI